MAIRPGGLSDAQLRSNWPLAGALVVAVFRVLARKGERVVASDVYQQLAQATPDQKVDIVLRLIEDHPEGRLELPAREDGTRADLLGIDLSQDALRRRMSDKGLGSAPWWDAQFQGANLMDAQFQGAILSDAQFQGAILWDAQFQRAILRGAQFQGAKLRGAQFQDAQLRGAQFQGAFLHGAQFQDADLEGTTLQGITLSQRSSFDRASWRNAKLQGVDLSQASIANVYVYDAWFDRTRLRREQLGEQIGEEREAETKAKSPVERARWYREADSGYLALKQNFDDLGDYSAASWAYRKERRMEKLRALQLARHAYDERRPWDSVRHFSKYFIDQALVEWISDYGESIRRVIVTQTAVFAFFTLLYAWPGNLVRGEGTNTAPWRVWEWDWSDAMLYSLGAMTTMGPTSLVQGPEPGHRIIQFAPGVQALVAIALLGLLAFVVANRIRRS
jgi:uncharacterized protein YjbI with pentapeptide repeats